MVYSIVFDSCFGPQLGAFCSSCDPLISPQSCTSCPSIFSTFNREQCRFGCLINQFPAPLPDGFPTCRKCSEIKYCLECQLQWPQTKPSCSTCEEGLDYDPKTRRCSYRPQGAESVIINSLEISKYVFSIATISMVVAKSQKSMTMIKTIQIFDYLGLANVAIPANLWNVLEIFNENFLSFIPNPFLNEELED